MKKVVTYVLVLLLTSACQSPATASTQQLPTLPPEIEQVSIPTSIVANECLTGFQSEPCPEWFTPTPAEAEPEVQTDLPSPLSECGPDGLDFSLMVGDASKYLQGEYGYYSVTAIPLLPGSTIVAPRPIEVYRNPHIPKMVIRCLSSSAGTFELIQQEMMGGHTQISIVAISSTKSTQVINPDVHTPSFSWDGRPCEYREVNGSDYAHCSSIDFFGK